MKFLTKVMYVTVLSLFLLLLPMSTLAEIPSREDTANTIQNQATTELANSTDSSSTNTTTQSASNQNVQNNNTSETNQTIEATANTGSNTTSRNISIGGDAGTITTGDAQMSATQVAGGNTNQTTVSNTSLPTQPAQTTIGNTGNNLLTTYNANSSTTTAITNSNTATINQITTAQVNTGNNTADRNISIGGQAGTIYTGNASIGVSYLTTQNGNVTLIGGMDTSGNPGSGASIIITSTGDRFTIAPISNSSTNTTITNTNQHALTQAAYILADTGHNSTSRNIGTNGQDAGVVKTGDAVVDVAMYAGGNTNDTYIATNSPSSVGNNASNIQNTRDQMGATSSNEKSSTTNVLNSNSATVYQTAYIYANTGFNSADRNISLGGNAGTISTGNAIIYLSFISKPNTNNTTLIPTQGNQITNSTVFSPLPTTPVGAVNPVVTYIYVPQSTQSSQTTTTASEGSQNTSHMTYYQPFTKGSSTYYPSYQFATAPHKNPSSYSTRTALLAASANPFVAGYNFSSVLLLLSSAGFAFGSGLIKRV